MTIELRPDLPALRTSNPKVPQDSPEDALFKQLVEQQDGKREKAKADGAPAAEPVANPLTGEQADAQTAPADADAATGPTRTELDALTEEAAGLTVNGKPVSEIDPGELSATLVNDGFDAANDAAPVVAVSAAERLAAEGARRNAAQPTGLGIAAADAPIAEKSTAAEALRTVAAGADAKPKPAQTTAPPQPADAASQPAPPAQPKPIKASVVDEAAPVVNKPNQTLTASAQAAAQRAQEIVASARDLARGPTLDPQEPAIAQPKADGAGVQSDAQSRQQQQNQPNGQALAQAAADKAAAQQAAAAQAAAKADAQAASRPAPTRADAPAPPPQPTQPAQAQGGQQSSFANMLQQQAKTPEGAKAEQNGFQHQARAAHQSHAVAEQVAVQIRKGFQGMDRISIQMKPAELGRVDVEMRLDSQGRIAIVIQADKPETLDMLQRESKTLEQSLKDAGFDLSDGALSFGSRGDGRGFAGRNDLDALAQFGAEVEGDGADDADVPAITPADALRRLSNPDAIDVVV